MGRGPVKCGNGLEVRADSGVQDLRLSGRELLVGEDARLVQLTEFLELLHRVLFRRGRCGGHLLLFLGGPLFFFLPGPLALLVMLHGPGCAARDGANGGYTGNAAK